MILLGNGKSSWYQWDFNQRIIITDIEIDQIEGQEVHFSSDVDTDTTALITKPYVENGIVYASVPNSLLTASGTIHIYLYLTDGTEAHTEVHKAVKVVVREKPSDYVYTETELKDYSALESRISFLEKYGVGGGSIARIGNVTILADNWNGEASPYSQIVEVDGVTENTQVDLTPSVEQLAVFYEKDLAFVTENDGGMVTVYAIGQKPTNDYTIQVTMTEVAI